MLIKTYFIAIAMLHDVGKLYELSEFPANDYTDQGQLLGHIFMGAELVQKSADKIEGFPQDLSNLIKHCILSHHGEFEYGSPVLPRQLKRLFFTVLIIWMQRSKQLRNLLILTVHREVGLVIKRCSREI